MSLIEPVFIGVDTTSGKSSFTYAVLDKDLRLLVLADGEMEDLISYVDGQSSVVLAINSPSSVNKGLLGKKLKDEATGQHQVRGAQMRLVEFELRQHGITVSGTASTIAACSSWMQIGFNLYRTLEKIGFAKYPKPDSQFQLMETHPHACYCVMADILPQPKPSLEGRLQRQLLLYERGVQIQDPMDFFEEITRHKMVKGTWPIELLYNPEQLDALVAAFTAWLAINKPAHVSSFGNEQEGKIILPVRELKEKY